MNTEHFSMGGCVRALRRAHTLLANSSLFNNEMRFFPSHSLRTSNLPIHVSLFEILHRNGLLK